jgi:hypothetical protein
MAVVLFVKYFCVTDYAHNCYIYGLCVTNGQNECDFDKLALFSTYRSFSEV